MSLLTYILLDTTELDVKILALMNTLHLNISMIPCYNCNRMAQNKLIGLTSYKNYDEINHATTATQKLSLDVQVMQRY